MLVLPFLGILAQTKEKQCEGKELRSANGLAGCTSLNFQFDPLSAAEITAVAKAVSGGEIGVLICRGCELGAAGMDVLGPALLSQDSITFMTLREDALGATGANYVAQLLNQSKMLTGLDLRSAGLEVDDSALATALRHPDSVLQILNLKVAGRTLTRARARTLTLTLTKALASLAHAEQARPRA